MNVKYCIYLNSFYWEKRQFPTFEKFVSRSVFLELRLTQISLNFKTSCFVLEMYLILNRIVPNFFMWKDVIEYNSCYKTYLCFSHRFVVIYDYYKDTFIPLWKNIDYWIWSSPKFKLDKFLTDFMGEKK